jgi:hypothetical protein
MPSRALGQSFARVLNTILFTRFQATNNRFTPLAVLFIDYLQAISLAL